MNEVQLKSLIEHYISGNHNPEEAALLIELLNTPRGLQQLNEIMESQLSANNATADEFPEVVSRIIEGINRQIADERKIINLNRKRIWKWSAAAAILVLVSISALILSGGPTEKTQGSVSATTNSDIAAGKEGAILTLDDGRTILLDSLGNQVVSTENGTTITLRNGQLIYQTANAASGRISYNTMTTPRGRQFQLVLPDGSKVWLNAASSIRYPTTFTNKERNVEITGEAYFEVAQNKSIPFIVKMDNETEVEVLGTQFNINSYENEERISTTLLEGSVRIKNREGSIVLSPGQQANVTGSEKIKVFNKVNLEKVMAWKNGVFNFQDASLQEVMRQLERWYDIDVLYEGKIPKLEFFGKMGKDLSLANVLRGLEMSEVSFRIENRKLIVLP